MDKLLKALQLTSYLLSKSISDLEIMLKETKNEKIKKIIKELIISKINEI